MLSLKQYQNLRLYLQNPISQNFCRANYLSLIPMFILMLSMILTSFLTIIANNPVQSVLLLIFLFLQGCLMLIIFGSEFIALTLLIVYVGAISTLFLFVVMMLNIRFVQSQAMFTYTPIGSFIGFLFIAEMIYAFYSDSHLSTVTFYNLDVPKLNNISNIVLIGDALFNHFSHLLIVASMVLFLAMIGVIVLTLDLNKRKKGHISSPDNEKLEVREVLGSIKK